MRRLSQKHAFRAFEYQVEAQEHVLENPKFLMSARAGEPQLKREIRAPSIFCRLDVRSNGVNRRLSVNFVLPVFL